MVSGQVLVTGDVLCERVFEVAELDARACPAREVLYRTRRRHEVHSVQGVSLHEVLSEIPRRPDARHKMGQLNVVVLATSADGYQVALTLAEIDPEFGGSTALLATRYNGELLASPTLVMPGDSRASRYVRSLARLYLRNLEPA